MVNFHVLNCDTHMQNIGFIRCNVSSPGNKRIYAKMKVNLSNQVYSPITLRILDSCKWECCVISMELKHKVCPALENAPEILNDENISLFVDILNLVTICTGKNGYTDVIEDRNHSLINQGLKL